jgi:hypothetical protein
MSEKEQKDKKEEPLNILRELDTNSIQRISDSFCNESWNSIRTAPKKESIEMTMPQKSLCELRNKIVDKMIFGVGQRLMQNTLTIHLAVKLFDTVFMH